MKRKNNASPRSRLGQAEEDKIKKQLRGAKSKIKILTDEGTNAFSDFAKFLEQHFNEHIKKEIKKKLN